MKLIGLAELSRRTGISRARLLTQLRALEHGRGKRGLVLVQKGKRKRMWVNEATLRHLQMLAQREIERRITHLEGGQQHLESRIDALEALVVP